MPDSPTARAACPPWCVQHQEGICLGEVVQLVFREPYTSAAGVREASLFLVRENGSDGLEFSTNGEGGNAMPLDDAESLAHAMLRLIEAARGSRGGGTP